MNDTKVVDVLHEAVEQLHKTEEGISKDLTVLMHDLKHGQLHPKCGNGLWDLKRRAQHRALLKKVISTMLSFM